MIASFIAGWIGVRLALCETLYCSAASGTSGTASVLAVSGFLGAVGTIFIWHALFTRIEWGNAMVFPAGLTLSGLMLLVV